MPAPEKYPDELRERAVRLVLESGRPIAHIAKRPEEYSHHGHGTRPADAGARAQHGRLTELAP